VYTQELLRGVFDAAMGVYLYHFLNIPPAKLPNQKPKTTENEDIADSGGGTSDYLKTLLKELPVLLDKQQQVNQVRIISCRLPL
jgi:hypothetical protein